MADRNELRIPTDRVPPEILDTLRQIGQMYRNEASSYLPSSYMTSAPNGQDCDEVDNFSYGSCTNNNVIHVINAEGALRNRSLPAENDSDVVSVFAKERSSPTNEFSPFMQQNPFTFTRPQSKDKDVVSVLSPSKSSPAPSRDSVSLNQLQQQQQLQSSSPQKLPGGGQQQLVYRDCRSLSTSSSNSGPSSQPSTPLKSLNSHDDDDDEKKRMKDVPKSLLKPEACRSPPMPPEGPVMASAPRPILSRSPHSQNLSGLTSSSNPPNDDSVVRLFPPPPHSVSEGPAQESSGQQMLTPPETPESGKNRKVVAEVFTFDEASCAQERLRQNKEQLRMLQQQQQEQFEPPTYLTPSKRSGPSTPRHPLISSPGTPSFRRQEVPRSPSYLPSTYRRISPVDPRFFERFEELSTISASPQTSKKEISSSPVGSHQGQTPMPQRLSLDDFNAPPRRETRESLSPKVPKKRLDFEEGDSGSLMSNVSSQQPMAPRSLQRGYESGAPYSPRLAASSSDSVFSYPAGARASPGTSGKSVSFSTLNDALEWMNYQAFYGVVDVDGDDERSSSFGAGTIRSLSNESGAELYRRHHYNVGGRANMKRKRPEEEAESALCTCAAMRQDFLLMAGNAFKKVRRRDSSQQEFERFEHELRRTNELLQDSMELMNQIRDICDHRGATETWRPRWYS